MKKIVSILIILLFSSLAFCQKTVNIDNPILGFSGNGGDFGKITITPEHYKIEIKPYYCNNCDYPYGHNIYPRQDYFYSYDEFYVESNDVIGAEKTRIKGDIIPVKVEGYTLGSKPYVYGKNFYVFG